MPSILDVAPPELSAEEVDIRGTPLSVRGLRADEWTALYARFPELRGVVAGQVDDISNFAAFMAQAALVAAGLNEIGNAETERLVTERLTRDEMQQLVGTIVRLSMPGNLYGPLLNGAGESPDLAPHIEAQATK